VDAPLPHRLLLFAVLHDSMVTPIGSSGFSYTHIPHSYNKKTTTHLAAKVTSQVVSFGANSHLCALNTKGLLNLYARMDLQTAALVNVKAFKRVCCLCSSYSRSQCC